MGHYVYKYVNNDEIIYIGKCDRDLDARLNQHGKRGDNIEESAWGEINNSDIYYAELANKVMSDVVESELIRKYQPKYNKAKKSKWSGVNFVEPVWYLYHRSDLVEIQDLKREIAFLNSQIKKLENDNALIKKEMERSVRQAEADCLSKIRGFNMYYNKEFVPYDEYQKSVSFDDILELYKNTEYHFAFISEAFNSKGIIVCKKVIYTTSFDTLNFDFWQANTNSASGIIYRNRTDKTMSQYPVLRNWKNRGSNMWYPYDIEKQALVG